MSNLATAGVRISIRCVKEWEVESEAVSIANAVSFLEGLESAFQEIERLAQNTSDENPLSLNDSLETLYYTCEDEGHFFYLKDDLVVNATKNKKLQDFRDNMRKEFYFYLAPPEEYDSTDQICTDFDEAFAKLNNNDIDKQAVIYALKAGFGDSLQKVMENYAEYRWQVNPDSFSHGIAMIEETYRYEDGQSYIDMEASIYYHSEQPYFKEFDSGMCTISKRIFESDKELLRLITEVENRIINAVHIKEQQYHLNSEGAV